MNFRATLELGRKTATGIEVPTKVVDALGSGKRPAVRVTIKGHTYGSTVASMAGRYMLPVSAEHRESAGFAAALKRETKAKKFFDGLSYSKQRWHVLSIESAKSPETRQLRIEKSIGMLREGRAR